MNSVQPKQSYQQSLQSPHFTAGEPAWLVEFRKNAFDRFQELGFPTRKHEAWKYIYLDGLLNRILTPAPVSRTALPAEIQKFQNRIVYYNGQMMPHESPARSHSYLFSDLTKIDWARNYLAHEPTGESNPFVHINTSQFQEGLFIRIPKDTVVAEPLHVFFIAAGNNHALPVIYPRILVTAEPGSKFELVLHHSGQNSEAYFMNSVVEFDIAANANVYCFVRQDESEQAVQFLNVRAQLAAGSRFEMVKTASGGSLIRNDIQANLDGENSFCQLAGLAVAGGKTQVFQHVHVNHRMTHCTSRQVYKNILADQSVAEFNSMVHVWRCAQKSDSEQLDKNLLLSNEARVYSRPQLKIDNDDVRASHGAATGQLDKNEVFYLRSRGLDADTAKFLMMRGFVQEVLQLIRPAEERLLQESQMENKLRSFTAKAAAAL